MGNDSFDNAFPMKYINDFLTMCHTTFINNSSIINTNLLSFNNLPQITILQENNDLKTFDVNYEKSNLNITSPFTSLQEFLDLQPEELLNKYNKDSNIYTKTPKSKNLHENLYMIFYPFYKISKWLPENWINPYYYQHLMIKNGDLSYIQNNDGPSKNDHYIYKDNDSLYFDKFFNYLNSTIFRNTDNKEFSVQVKNFELLLDLVTNFCDFVKNHSSKISLSLHNENNISTNIYKLSKFIEGNPGLSFKDFLKEFQDKGMDLYQKMQSFFYTYPNYSKYDSNPDLKLVLEDINLQYIINHLNINYNSEDMNHEYQSGINQNPSNRPPNISFDQFLKNIYDLFYKNDKKSISSSILELSNFNSLEDKKNSFIDYNQTNQKHPSYQNYSSNIHEYDKSNNLSQTENISHPESKNLFKFNSNSNCNPLNNNSHLNKNSNDDWSHISLNSPNLRKSLDNQDYFHSFNLNFKSNNFSENNLMYEDCYKMYSNVFDYDDDISDLDLDNIFNIEEHIAKFEDFIVEPQINEFNNNPTNPFEYTEFFATSSKQLVEYQYFVDYLNKSSRFNYQDINYKWNKYNLANNIYYVPRSKTTFVEEHLLNSGTSLKNHTNTSPIHFSSSKYQNQNYGIVNPTEKKVTSSMDNPHTNPNFSLKLLPFTLSKEELHLIELILIQLYNLFYTNNKNQMDLIIMFHPFNIINGNNPCYSTDERIVKIQNYLAKILNYRRYFYHNSISKHPSMKFQLFINSIFDFFGNDITSNFLEKYSLIMSNLLKKSNSIENGFKFYLPNLNELQDKGESLMKLLNDFRNIYKDHSEFSDYLFFKNEQKRFLFCNSDNNFLPESQNLVSNQQQIKDDHLKLQLSLSTIYSGATEDGSTAQFYIDLFKSLIRYIIKFLKLKQTKYQPNKDIIIKKYFYYIVNTFSSDIVRNNVSREFFKLLLNLNQVLFLFYNVSINIFTELAFKFEYFIKVKEDTSLNIRVSDCSLLFQYRSVFLKLCKNPDFYLNHKEEFIRDVLEPSDIYLYCLYSHQLIYLWEACIIILSKQISRSFPLEESVDYLLHNKTFSYILILLYVISSKFPTFNFSSIMNLIFSNELYTQNYSQIVLIPFNGYKFIKPNLLINLFIPLVQNYLFSHTKAIENLIMEYPFYLLLLFFVCDLKDKLIMKLIARIYNKLLSQLSVHNEILYEFLDIIQLFFSPIKPPDIIAVTDFTQISNFFLYDINLFANNLQNLFLQQFSINHKIINFYLSLFQVYKLFAFCDISDKIIYTEVHLINVVNQPLTFENFHMNIYFIYNFYSFTVFLEYFKLYLLKVPKSFFDIVFIISLFIYTLNNNSIDCFRSSNNAQFKELIWKFFQSINCFHLKYFIFDFNNSDYLER